MIPEDTLRAILVGYGSIGLVVGIAVLMTSEHEKRKRSVELFCSLIIAVATVALVGVTILNLRESEKLRQSSQDMAQSTSVLAEKTNELSEETKRMADETKRLADISIQQFKIVSFPSLQSSTPEVKYENGKIIQKFKLSNKGDITIHKVKVFLVYVFKKDNEGYSFRWDFTPTYEKDKPVKTFDYEVKIFGKGGYRELTTDESLAAGFTISDLKYCLLFIRYWVPYDPNYTFETFGYILKTNKIDSKTDYNWHEIKSKDIVELDNLHSKALERNTSTAGEEVKNFFTKHIKDNS